MLSFLLSHYGWVGKRTIHNNLESQLCYVAYNYASGLSCYDYPAYCVDHVLKKILCLCNCGNKSNKDRPKPFRDVIRTVGSASPAFYPFWKVNATS